MSRKRAKQNSGRKKRDLTQLSQVEIQELTLGRRYVFYESLKSESSPIYQKLYRQALNRIINVKSNFGITSTGSAGTGLSEALVFLKNSAEFERQKELQFFQNFNTAHPEIRKSFNINPEDILNDYHSFIININRALRGTEEFNKTLNAELKRIHSNNDAFQKYQNKLNLTSQKMKDQNFNKKQYEEDLKKDLNKQKGINNSLFAMKANGKAAFESIFIDHGKMTILTNIIVKQYGAKLFNRNLQLDPGQKDALLAALTIKANEMLSNSINIALPKDKFEQTAEEIISSSAFEQFTELLLESPELGSVLQSMQKQYGMSSKDFNQINDLDKKISRIQTALKSNWDLLQKTGKTKLNYDEWIKSIGMQPEEIKKMIAAASTVSTQCYYVGEDLSMLELVANHIRAILGGTANPTDDIEAGALITTFNFNAQTLSNLEDKLWKSQKEHFGKVTATSTYESYMKNTLELIAARQEQEMLIQKFINENNENNEALNDLITHFNIHSTVKGYESAGSGIFQQEGGFGGAAFGSTLDSELDIINSMIEAGGLTPLDTEQLFIAMINCGKLMIGKALKPTIENYFSALMGMFMFNDATLFAADVNKWVQNSQLITGSVQDLHLYQLNGLVVPSSYILQETYNIMSQLQTSSFGPNYKGMQVKLTTYNKEPIRNDWEATSAAAIATTKLERMHFLAGFLDLLESLGNRLSSL